MRQKLRDKDRGTRTEGQGQRDRDRGTRTEGQGQRDRDIEEGDGSGQRQEQEHSDRARCTGRKGYG